MYNWNEEEKVLVKRQFQVRIEMIGNIVTLEWRWLHDLHITITVHWRNAKESKTSATNLAEIIPNLHMVWSIIPVHDIFPFSACGVIILIAELYDAIPQPRDI